MQVRKAPIPLDVNVIAVPVVDYWVCDDEELEFELEGYLRASFKLWVSKEVTKGTTYHLLGANFKRLNSLNLRP